MGKTDYYLPAVYLDIESQYLADEVGGWAYIQSMGIAVAVLYDEATEDFEVYRKKDVNKLVLRLVRAPLVVGFNLLRFDYGVLKGALARQISTPIEAAELLSLEPEQWAKVIPTIDLLKYIHNERGHRLKLEQVALGTLGERGAKPMDGRQAVLRWREGTPEAQQEVIEYCMHDVDVTRQIFRFGVEKGTYWFINRQNKVGYGRATWKEPYEGQARRKGTKIPKG